MSAHLLFLVTEDWYFCSHRLALARAARAAGYRVGVATRVREHGEMIRDAGLELHPLGWRRGERRPWREALAVVEIARLYRRLAPDIVHHVALKPVVLGSLAARLARPAMVVNAVAGLGFAFASPGWRAAVLRPVLRAALRRALATRASSVVVQNPDDAAAVGALGVAADRCHLIPGSGVDTARFLPLPEPPGPPVAALVGRMLWDKGIGEMAEAGRLLRGQDVTLELVGARDPDNPACVPEATLRAWDASGAVRWHGAVDDVRAVWARASIAVLPSYREGLPMSLLEAAACGRPIVTTDVPGCREVVVDGETGLLVPPRDPRALADAIARLAADAVLRRRLGAAARRRVEARFAREIVVGQTLDLYARLLAGRGT